MSGCCVLHSDSYLATVTLAKEVCYYYPGVALVFDMQTSTCLFPLNHWNLLLKSAHIHVLTDHAAEAQGYSVNYCALS